MGSDPEHGRELSLSHSAIVPPPAPPPNPCKGQLRDVGTQAWRESQGGSGGQWNRSQARLPPSVESPGTCWLVSPEGQKGSPPFWALVPGPMLDIRLAIRPSGCGALGGHLLLPGNWVSLDTPSPHPYFKKSPRPKSGSWREGAERCQHQGGWPGPSPCAACLRQPPPPTSTCTTGSGRRLCWKSAFNLSFLFSAPTRLSFKLFHTRFSKLSSSPTSREVWVQRRGDRPFPLPLHPCPGNSRGHRPPGPSWPPTQLCVGNRGSGPRGMTSPHPNHYNLCPHPGAAPCPKWSRLGKPTNSTLPQTLSSAETWSVNHASLAVSDTLHLPSPGCPQSAFPKEAVG